MTFLGFYAISFGLLAVQLMNPHWCESIIFALCVTAALLALLVTGVYWTSFEFEKYELPCTLALLFSLTLAAQQPLLSTFLQNFFRLILYVSSLGVFIIGVEKTRTRGFPDLIRSKPQERILLSLACDTSMVIILAANYALTRKFHKY